MGRNPGPERSETLRAYHRAEIANRYLRQNQTQAQIARALGISQQTVSRELKLLREDWQDRALNDLTAFFAEQLARIALLESENWEAWHRSREDLVTVTTVQDVHDKDAIDESSVPTARSHTGGAGATLDDLPASAQPEPATALEGDVPGERNRIRAGVRREVSIQQTRVGDPRFLRGVQECIESRARLLGLYDPHMTANIIASIRRQQMLDAETYKAVERTDQVPDRTSDPEPDQSEYIQGIGTSSSGRPGAHNRCNDTGSQQRNARSTDRRLAAQPRQAK